MSVPVTATHLPGISQRELKVEVLETGEVYVKKNLTKRIESEDVGRHAEAYPRISQRELKVRKELWHHEGGGIGNLTKRIESAQVAKLQNCVVALNLTKRIESMRALMVVPFTVARISQRELKGHVKKVVSEIYDDRISQRELKAIFSL